MKKIASTFFSPLITVSLLADVTLPKIFGDHMVLQRDQPVYIWGSGNPKEKVTVQFHNQTKKTTADKSGKWKIALDRETAGGPYTLTVKGKNSVLLNDVLVGDVWICSGQSNMEWPLRNANNA